MLLQRVTGVTSPLNELASELAQAWAALAQPTSDLRAQPPPLVQRLVLAQRLVWCNRDRVSLCGLSCHCSSPMYALLLQGVWWLRWFGDQPQCPAPVRQVNSYSQRAI